MKTKINVFKKVHILVDTDIKLSVYFLLQIV